MVVALLLTAGVIPFIASDAPPRIDHGVPPIQSSAATDVDDARLLAYLEGSRVSLATRQDSAKRIHSLPAEPISAKPYEVSRKHIECAVWLRALPDSDADAVVAMYLGRLGPDETTERVVLLTALAYELDPARHTTPFHGIESRDGSIWNTNRSAIDYKTASQINRLWRRQHDAICFLRKARCECDHRKLPHSTPSPTHLEAPQVPTNRQLTESRDRLDPSPELLSYVLRNLPREDLTSDWIPSRYHLSVAYLLSQQDSRDMEIAFATYLGATNFQGAGLRSSVLLSIIFDTERCEEPGPPQLLRTVRDGSRQIFFAAVDPAKKVVIDQISRDLDPIKYLRDLHASCKIRPDLVHGVDEDMLTWSGLISELRKVNEVENRDTTLPNENGGR